MEEKETGKQPEKPTQEESCEAGEPASGVCFANSPEVRPEYRPDIPGQKADAPEKPNTEQEI